MKTQTAQYEISAVIKVFTVSFTDTWVSGYLNVESKYCATFMTLQYLLVVFNTTSRKTMCYYAKSLWMCGTDWMRLPLHCDLVICKKELIFFDKLDVQVSDFSTLLLKS